MKLRMVDPKTIKVPEVRVTARMSEETTEQFKSSIATVGIDEPIKCFEVDGELYLSDGLHRLVEAINQGIIKVPVTVRPGTMVDVLANNLMSGHLRGKHPISEMRRSIKTLYKEFNLGIEEIVKRTGLTQAYVEKLLIISELTPLVLEALDQERIGVGQAELLTRIKQPEVQEVVFNQLQTYHWRNQQLEDYIKMVLETPSPNKPPEVHTQAPVRALVKCRYCRGDFEPERIASVLVCDQCSAIMFEAVAVARSQVPDQVPVPGDPGPAAG